MGYNPFERGRAPVGVRSATLEDAARGGRRVPVEVWYPAAEAHAGQDLDVARQDRFTVAPGLPPLRQSAVRDASPEDGSFPLLLYFHGSTRHRRDATELCTHLASHGYVVAAPDFEGNTLADQLQHRTGPGDAPRLKSLSASAEDRPRDAQLVMDRLKATVDPELARIIDDGTIGVLGISFGGWTCLALNCVDDRPAAAFALVPAWGPGPAGTEMLAGLVRLDDWRPHAPTFLLAAERDAFVMLPSVRQLYEELPAPKRMAVLANAGHVHFCDHAERFHEAMRTSASAALSDDVFPFNFSAIAEASRPFSELCPAWHGEQASKALCLAHFDAHLKRLAPAGDFLTGDFASRFKARGIGLEVV